LLRDGYSIDVKGDRTKEASEREAQTDSGVHGLKSARNEGDGR
jgi:hypothetical protein